MSINESTETTEPTSVTAKAKSKGIPDVAPLDSKSGGLPEGSQLGLRKIVVSPEVLSTLPEIDIVGGKMVGPSNVAVPALRRFEAGYIGTKLVDKAGVPVRDQYQDNEVMTLLSLMTNAQREEFQNNLASRGVYGKNGRPLGGTGFSSEDISVMKQFKDYSNAEGLTIDAALQKFLAETTPYVAPRKVIRTTAKQDIRSVLQKTTQEILGRSLSPNEIEKFVKTYERMEITEGMGGVRAPRLDVAAEQQVQQQFGPEAEAVRALGFLDILDKKIKGLA
jgi:hypothetical protein